MIPFHPHDGSFNRANAVYLAHAADIAYLRAPVTTARDRLGLVAVPFRNKLTRTRGFVGVCDTHAVLAFRGTDPVTLPNWFTDVAVKLVQCDEYQGRVHTGFSSALRRTWSVIEQMLESSQKEIADRPLFLTGHSLGGALAVLAAVRLAKSGCPPTATYTFGAPRIGDPAFCEAYGLRTYRVVNRLDLVPEMPLASVKALLPDKPRFTNDKILNKFKRMAERVPSYGHVNTFVYLDRDGVISTDADVEPWHRHAVERAISTRGKSFLEGITDHLISNYIRGLESRGVPHTGRVRRRSDTSQTKSQK